MRTDGGLGSRLQLAFEHQLYLVRVMVVWELVVSADVVPHEAQPPHVNVGANLLPALPPQGIWNRLSVTLPPAGQVVPVAQFVDSPDGQQALLHNDDRLDG
jgi:hypothetical protein